MAGLFDGSLEFVDYQGAFPHEFSTYDALHPTWHGARLHALDIVLRMHKNGILDESSPESIAGEFTAMEAAAGETYNDGLSGSFDPLNRPGFRRYDLFEPENAKMLMRLLATYQAGSYTESDHLYNLSLRLRNWREQQFSLPGPGYEDQYGAAFNKAAMAEIDRSRQRVDEFQKRLVQYQQGRLIDYPLPDLGGAVPTDRKNMADIGGKQLYFESFSLPDGKSAISYKLGDGREVARGVLPTQEQSGFLRVDVLGDASFLSLQGLADPLRLPTWVTHTKPFVRFGI